MDIWVFGDFRCSDVWMFGCLGAVYVCLFWMFGYIRCLWVLRGSFELQLIVRGVFLTTNNPRIATKEYRNGRNQTGSHLRSCRTVPATVKAAVPCFERVSDINRETPPPEARIRDSRFFGAGIGRLVQGWLSKILWFRYCSSTNIRVQWSLSCVRLRLRLSLHSTQAET